MKEYLQRILRAHHVYDVAIETPLELASGLSQRLGNPVYLKREDLQSVHSFKLRGAHNKISNLSAQARAKGVITASAGNHAQGVALSANKAGIPATIVMPKTTPSIKVNSVKQLGGNAVLHGNSYDEAYIHAHKLAQEQGLSFIHPYDDPDVIAGQGTVALEILRQYRGDIHAIFVPVGGGGLLAGTAVLIKQVMPQIKVIGVEPEDAPCMHHALEAGERVILEQAGLFADGVAVRQAGEEPFRIAKELVDEIILVSTDEICASIKDIFDDTRSIAEPAGALAVAGIKKYVARQQCEAKTLIAIDSGANVNFDRLRHISERAELGEQREVIFAATIPEQPGSFKAFCQSIGKKSITEFNYRYADQTNAHVFVGIELDGEKSKEKLLSDLEAKGYQPEDMSANEMAKLHVRYMVGGRADKANDEILFRFEFPERPGALLHFLNGIGKHWNISMFHYRNHGAAYGRVLVGVQVREQEKPQFIEFLDSVGYPYWEETDNPAYKLFLK